MAVPSWGVTLQWWGWCPAMSPLGPSLVIPGPSSRQEMASIVWPLRLMFDSTAGRSRDRIIELMCVDVLMGWLIFSWSSLNSVPRGPLVWRVFPGWHCSISLHCFKSAEAIFTCFRICCCAQSVCCFRGQIDTMVKASSGLSPLVSASDLLELKIPSCF